ncbi:MAG: hypothetical protein ACLPTL_11840 [Steroidobacteraceae bacterium]
MRRAALALTLLGALSGYAQTPPDTAPPPASQTPEPAAAAAPGAPTEAPAPPETPTPPQAEPREPAAPAPSHASAPRAAIPHPPASPQGQPLTAPERDGELATLRAEVNRLQSELDAERAAAAQPAAEEGGALSEPVRSAWEWLVGAALLALAGGFVLGWRVLDRRIRRKYGGLRIY